MRRAILLIAALSLIGLSYRAARAQTSTSITYTGVQLQSKWDPDPGALCPGVWYDTLDGFTMGYMPPGYTNPVLHEHWIANPSDCDHGHTGIGLQSDPGLVLPSGSLVTSITVNYIFPATDVPNGTFTELIGLTMPATIHFYMPVTITNVYQQSPMITTLTLYYIAPPTNTPTNTPTASNTSTATFTNTATNTPTPSNTPATFCVTLDFTTSAWGFQDVFPIYYSTGVSGTSGVWVNGTGWTAQPYKVGDYAVGSYIFIHFATSHFITSLEYHGTLSIAGGGAYNAAGEAEAGFLDDGFGLVGYRTGNQLSSGAIDQKWTDAGNYAQHSSPVGINDLLIFLQAYDDATTSSSSGTATLSDLEVCGLGRTPPEFIASPTNTPTPTNTPSNTPVVTNTPTKTLTPSISPTVSNTPRITFIASPLPTLPLGNCGGDPLAVCGTMPYPVVHLPTIFLPSPTPYPTIDTPTPIPITETPSLTATPTGTFISPTPATTPTPTPFVTPPVDFGGYATQIADTFGTLLPVGGAQISLNNTPVGLAAAAQQIGNGAGQALGVINAIQGTDLNQPGGIVTALLLILIFIVLVEVIVLVLPFLLMVIRFVVQVIGALKPF